jgi:hypothetical protein
MKILAIYLFKNQRKSPKLIKNNNNDTVNKFTRNKKDF